METLYDAFWRAELFNQPIDSWNVSKVTDMDFVFQEAFTFNQNLNSWDSSLVTTVDDAFREAIEFNGDIVRTNLPIG